MPMKRFLIATAVLSLAAGTALASPTGKTTLSLTFVPHAANAWSQITNMPTGYDRVTGSDPGEGLGVEVWHQQSLNDHLSWGVGGHLGRGSSTLSRAYTYTYTNISPAETYRVPSQISQRVIYEAIRGGLDFHPSSTISATLGADLGHTNLRTSKDRGVVSTGRTALRPMLDVMWIASWGSIEAHYAQQPWIMPATHVGTLTPTAYPAYAAPRQLRLEFWTIPSAWGSIGITAAAYRPDESRPILATGHRLALTYEAPDRSIDIQVGRVTGYQLSQPSYSTPGLPALVAAVAPMEPWRAYMQGVYASATVQIDRWQVEGIVMAEPGQAESEHPQAVYSPHWGVTTNWTTATTRAGGTYLALRVAYSW